MEKMTDDQVWAFFDSQPGWAALTTMDEDGFPHTVAIGYFRLGRRLFCGCRSGTRKTDNIQRNPKVSLMIESGRSQDKSPPGFPSDRLAGVMFQGRAQVHLETEPILQIKRELAQQRGEDPPTAVQPGVAYIEIEVGRIRSWVR